MLSIDPIAEHALTSTLGMWKSKDIGVKGKEEFIATDTKNGIIRLRLTIRWYTDGSAYVEMFRCGGHRCVMLGGILKDYQMTEETISLAIDSMLPNGWPTSHLITLRRGKSE